MSTINLREKDGVTRVITTPQAQSRGDLTLSTGSSQHGFNVYELESRDTAGNLVYRWHRYEPATK